MSNWKPHEPGYETRDVNTHALARWLGVFVLTAVLIHGAVWWLFGYFRSVNERRDVRRTVIDRPSAIPPEPRLQTNPKEEFLKFFASQQRVLKTYGWVSRESGIVRIPIERAMQKQTFAGQSGSPKPPRKRQ